MESQICEIDGCKRPRYGRQPHCEAHYRRKRRTGTVNPGLPIGVVAKTICMVETCDKTSTARGFCHGHYLRLIRVGDVQADRPLGRRRNGRCTVDGCKHPAGNRRLCKTHAGRLRKFGDVQADKPIREIAGDGYLNHGYLIVPVPPRLRHLSSGAASTSEHRLVMAKYLNRPLRVDESVHHINGDRLDNRIENLELWSRWQPSGQRLSDKIEWATEVLATHAPERLADPRKLE
jgi:HNH endonuclease